LEELRESWGTTWENFTGGFWRCSQKLEQVNKFGKLVDLRLNMGGDLRDEGAA